jgi:hypothetical protein
VTKIWPFKKKPPSDIDIFKSFARSIFDEVIAGDDYAGKVFRTQSAQNIRLVESLDYLEAAIEVSLKQPAEISKCSSQIFSCEWVAQCGKKVS